MFLILLKGSSQYGALELHIDQLADALVAAGNSVEVLDTSAPDFGQQLMNAARLRPQAFLSMNGIAADLKIDEASAYDRIGAAFASIYLDSPLHHLDRLAAPTRRKAAFVLDETHLDVVRLAPWGADFGAITFLPPAAIVSQANTETGRFQDRDIDLLFTGTFRGELERFWRLWPEGPTKAVLDELMDRMTAAGDLPILNALALSLESLDIEPTPQRLSNFLPVLHLPLSFAEAYHRSAFIRTLGQAGVPVTIYGQGWAGIAERFPSFDYRGPGSFTETLALLRRTRIVLNTNNGFVAGGHERVFTAMASGAHVFSDASTFYTRAFEEDREISTFQWSDLAQAPARLEGLLADHDGLAARADAGRKRALSEHTWANRVDSLLAALEGV